MVNILLILVSVLLISACHTNTLSPAALHTNQTELMIELSYQYNGYEAPMISRQQATILAVNQCKAKGYTYAREQQTITTECNKQSSNGCNAWRITQAYLCTSQ
ncbi:YecR family lipoprotein [Shewanella marina]|uniref:YecR family lipoprotein n=1 Tax=Shewanella marina TaxID=487319 RepID=UPI0004714D5F|nr:YecR family lipoprotein [Shewanella marina]